MKTLLLIVPFYLVCFIAQANTLQWSDTTVVELITFESESAYFVQGTPTTNIWQVGKPSKTLFTEAYSGTNAVVTDTLNPFPANNHSYFDLRINLNEDYWFINIGIGFYHKIQTESTNDGGYITVSYDKGVTWNNIVNDSVCPFIFSPSNPMFPNVNLYSTNELLFNGEPGFSGTLSEWQYVEFYWYIRMLTKSPMVVDTLLIRFNFISDTSSNALDGWMIDDIRLFYNHFNGGISGGKGNNKLQVFPNPVTYDAAISTNNNQVIEKVEVFSLTGQFIQSESVKNSEYQFKKGNLDPGIYFIRCTFTGSATETIKVVVEN